MGLAVAAVLLVVAFLTFAITGGFISHCATLLPGLQGYDSNEDLKNAHKYASIAAVVTWITIALMVIGFVLY